MAARTSPYACVAALLLCGGLLAVPNAAPAPDKATAYVAVADSAGNPVTGLSAPDFLVQIDGHEQLVLDARPATKPLSVAFVVDLSLDEAPYVRSAMKTIVAAMQKQDPQSRASFVRAAQPPVTLVSVTDHGGDLTRVTSAFVTAFTFLPGILEGSKALRAEETNRRVVFTFDMLARGGDDLTDVGRVEASLRASHTALWGVAFAPVQQGTSVAERKLDDVTAASGGTRERVNQPDAIEGTASRLTSLILSEYVVTYAPPKEPAGLRFGVRHANMKVWAPFWMQ